MKMIAYLFAIICVIAAVMYFVMPPANCRPSCRAIAQARR